MIQDILYITKNKSFLTQLQKNILSRVISKGKNNETLKDNEIREIKQMKRRIKMFLVSNEMTVNTRLKKIIREPLTLENKQRNSTFKKGRTSFSGHYNSNGCKI